MSSKRSKVTNQSVGLQIQRYIRKHAEHKFFENIVSNIIDITWNISPVTSGIVQGISGSQRIGDNITYLCLRLVGRITVNPTASFSNTRLVIVLDKMNDGTVPNFSDLFLNNGIDSTYSPEQIKAKRFTILKDQIFCLNTQGIGAYAINEIIKLNQVASYNGTTNTTSANGKNSMWCFVINDNGTNKPSINLNFQVEFMDD